MAITKLNSLAIPPDTVVESDISFPLDSASFTGDLTVDTDTLVVDSTNDRIGIGVNPTNKLDISGGITVQQAADIKWQNTARNTTYGGVKSTASALSLTWNGSDEVVVNSSGNVGIGEPSPAALTHISSSYVAPTGGISADTKLIVSNNNVASGVAGISLLSRSNVQSRINFGSQLDEDNCYILGGVSQLDFGTNALTRMTIDYSGRVGIGVTNPTKDLELYLLKAQRWQTGSTTLDLTPTAGATDQFVFNTSQNAFIDFKMNGVAKASITTNGITFNGDTAAANALDDYEEGTWTPTVFGSTSGSANFTGIYTKIGRVVTCHFFIENTASTAFSGNLKMSGLPFGVPNAPTPSGDWYFGDINHYRIATGGLSMYLYSPAGNSTTVEFYIMNNTGANSVQLNQGMLANSSVYIRGSLTYITT